MVYAGVYPFNASEHRELALALEKLCLSDPSVALKVMDPPHPSPLTSHSSPLTPYPLPLTSHPSPITPHPTPHPSPHPSPLITQ